MDDKLHIDYDEASARMIRLPEGGYTIELNIRSNRQTVFFHLERAEDLMSVVTALTNAFKVAHSHLLSEASDEDDDKDDDGAPEVSSEPETSIVVTPSVTVESLKVNDIVFIRGVRCKYYGLYKEKHAFYPEDPRADSEYEGFEYTTRDNLGELYFHMTDEQVNSEATRHSRTYNPDGSYTVNFTVLERLAKGDKVIIQGVECVYKGKKFGFHRFDARGYMYKHKVNYIYYNPKEYRHMYTHPCGNRYFDLTDEEVEYEVTRVPKGLIDRPWYT
ncbi:MAG: hypothetical protein K2H86_06005 [Muribaculaceae bacterium]|nr:hypothetical protein [Muribaculaceae bacterium]